ncbi:MAG TPA: hypothetical protein VLG69_04880 [Candidatus Andersenbacteria bacterium]|nr:hypothetical protein [Candidatus Andersenbacteria bacterium]
MISHSERQQLVLSASGDEMVIDLSASIDLPNGACLVGSVEAGIMNVARISDNEVRINGRNLDLVKMQRPVQAKTWTIEDIQACLEGRVFPSANLLMAFLRQWRFIPKNWELKSVVLFLGTIFTIHGRPAAYYLGWDADLIWISGWCYLDAELPSVCWVVVLA